MIENIQNVQGLRGEYRTLTAWEVGGLLRLMRASRGIKRAALAAEANVSEKTIERAEAGEGISQGSLQRIARALGIQENTFTEELFIPTPEEAERIQMQREEDVRKTHRPIPVHRVEGARDILPLFSCYGSFADSQLVSEEHLKEFASLRQALIDYGDIWSDISETERVESAAEMVKAIREFESRGYIVKCGVTSDYRIRGESWPCSVIVAFKKPKGTVATPDEVWLPKEARIGF